MGRFYKQQTKYSWVPSAIFCEAGGARSSQSVQVGIRGGYSNDPDHPCPNCKRPELAEIELTPHEALALAAWLQTEADKIVRREQRVLARKAERQAAKAKKEGL